MFLAKREMYSRFSVLKLKTLIMTQTKSGQTTPAKVKQLLRRLANSIPDGEIKGSAELNENETSYSFYFGSEVLSINLLKIE